MFTSILDYIRSDLYHTLAYRHPRSQVRHDPLALFQSIDGVSLGKHFWGDREIETNLAKTKPGSFTTFDHFWFIPDRANYQNYILGLAQNEIEIAADDIPDLIGFESEFGCRQHQIDGLINTQLDGSPSVEMHNLYLYWGYWDGEIDHKEKRRKKFVCHRENGPARVYMSKLKKWHKDGKRYRVGSQSTITCDRFHALWMHKGELIEGQHQERPQSVCVTDFREWESVKSKKRGLEVQQTAKIDYIWRMNQRTYHTKVLEPIYKELSRRGLDFNLLATGSVYGSSVARMAFYSELSKHVG